MEMMPKVNILMSQRNRENLIFNKNADCSSPSNKKINEGSFSQKADQLKNYTKPLINN